MMCMRMNVLSMKKNWKVHDLLMVQITCVNLINYCYHELGECLLVSKRIFPRNASGNVEYSACRIIPVVSTYKRISTFFGLIIFCHE